MKVTKHKNTVSLVDSGKDEGKKEKKGKEAAHPNVLARGTLLGSNNVEADLSGFIEFQGNFSGAFEEGEGGEHYFEGTISRLKVIRIDHFRPSDAQMLELQELTQFKGFFKGYFISKEHQRVDESENLPHRVPLAFPLLNKTAGKTEYHVPAMVRVDLRKISEINLEKSSAEIAAILYIDIKLNEEVLGKIYNREEEAFREKYKLSIDFHRGKPLVLPFYNPGDFEDTDDEIQYEWDDVWEGIDFEVEWRRERMTMSYSIRMTYTAEIDNSHGIFLAPFNLNILKIIIDFHSVKVGKEGKICINCCDLTDFNPGHYSPYTPFNDLHRAPADRSDHQQLLRRHIDRLTKIDTTQFVDQGEYKVANNRLSLFPYHKRVFKNKNEISSDYAWTVGLSQRGELLVEPEVKSVKEGYEYFLQHGEHSVFEVEEWEFVHVEIPIFKYPVIDMIRIFVPIIILSAISMTIFVQENAVDGGGFTELAKRIASGCSLMIAYVALIPMIRENLPPTPSVTLVEILIYVSTVPNFLAIISVFTTSFADYQDFFNNYKPFLDPLFEVSFAICVLSFLTLATVMIVYAQNDYKSAFTIYKFSPSPMKNLRSPVFLKYFDSVRKMRREYHIEELPVDYEEEEAD